MAAVAPDIALLRNQIIRKLRGMPGGTYEAIGKELGVSRQSVRKLVQSYNLDDQGSDRVLLDSDRFVVQVAEKWGVKPPVPIEHAGLKARN